MSTLPKGWALAQLSDIVEPFQTIDPGKTPEKTFQYVEIGSIDNTNFKIVEPSTITGANAPSRARRVIKTGDILFSTVRTYLKNIAIVPEELDGQLTSTGIAVIRPNQAIVGGLLFRYVISEKFLTTISGQQDGTLYPAITDKDLFASVIPLAPLAEQKRLFAKVDSLSAKSARAREELARVEKLVSRLKERVLARAFGSSLDSVSLNSFVTGIKAGKNLKCVERPPYKDEKGVVKVSAVTWGEFDPLESKTLPLDFNPSADTLIRAGDFLFSRANTIELVGAAVIVRTAPDNLYLSDKILRLDFGIDAKPWILYYLRSPQGRHALQDISSGNQLSMRNIGQKSLMQLKVPNADANKRAETVRHIESAFAKIDIIAAESRRALELTDRLDEAILTKAFRGELVPQDPNDEPASVLLERVRSKRDVKLDIPSSPRKPGRPSKVKPSAPFFRESPTPVEKSRLDVAPDHLKQLLTADGHMTSEALWRRSGMSVDEFYKQLRLEINARTIHEGEGNRLEAA